MKELFKRTFIKYAGIGAGLSFGFVASALLAVTISGTINSFTSGDQLDATKMNENFESLKTAVEQASEMNVSHILAISPVNNWCGYNVNCFTSLARDTASNRFSNDRTEELFPVPRKGTISNLQYKCASNNLNSALIVTARVDATDTSFDFSIPAGSVANNQVSGNLTVNSGSSLTFRFSTTSSSGNASCLVYYKY